MAVLIQDGDLHAGAWIAAGSDVGAVACGSTRACGSAACAAAVCAARLEKTGRKVLVHLPGGSLEIEWRHDNFIIMTGEAEHEFDGMMDPVTGAWERV